MVVLYLRISAVSKGAYLLLDVQVVVRCVGGRRDRHFVDDATVGRVAADRDVDWVLRRVAVVRLWARAVHLSRLPVTFCLVWPANHMLLHLHQVDIDVILGFLPRVLQVYFLGCLEILLGYLLGRRL